MPALFGLDMLTLFGLAIVGCGALGWLVGPAVGGGLFKAMNRKAVLGMVEVRDRPLLFSVAGPYLEVIANTSTERKAILPTY